MSNKSLHRTGKPVGEVDRCLVHFATEVTGAWAEHPLVPCRFTICNKYEEQNPLKNLNFQMGSLLTSTSFR